MHPHPLDGFTIVAWVIHIHGAVKRGQLRTLALDVLMAIPTSITGWNVGMASHIDKGMAVAAIQPELVNVDFMGKWDRLAWLIAYRKGLRCRVVCECKSHTRCCSACADSDF